MRRKINSLPSFAVYRPISTVMFFLLLLIWGGLAFKRIPVELLPNTSFNNISILASIRGGMAPEEVEKMVTTPIEEAMSNIPNLKSIQSTSKEGKSNIVLSFPAGTNMDLVSIDVGEKYDSIKNQLPRELDRPVIAKYEQSDVPIMILSLRNKDNTTLSIEDIRLIADRKVKPALQRVKGIANVEVSGGREKKILVEVQNDQLRSKNLTIDQITQAIGRNNLNVLAGSINQNQSKLLLRTKAQFENLEELKNIIVKSKGLKDIVRVADVATVQYKYMDQQNIARINGKPVVSLYLQKESNGNTVAISQRIKETLAQLKEDLPKDLSLEVISDQSLFITKAIHNVQSSLKTGAFFAIIVLFLFLGQIRPTLIISLSIPISVIITIACMYFSKISLNVMSLSGLALGIGMLVDNSIVVLENISKKMENRMNRNKASIEGTEEIFLALLASTATTLVVFLPIVFVNPQTKILYGGLALTVVYSLLSSLLVSMLLVPCLFAKGKKKNKHTKKTSKKRWIRKVHNTYKHSLSISLRYRYFVVGTVSILLLFSSFFFLLVDKDLSSGTQEGKFTIFIELPSGTKMDISNRISKKVEKVLKKYSEIKTYSTRVEGWSTKIYINLHENWVSSTALIMEKLREEVSSLGEKDDAFIYLGSGKGSGATEISLEIFGYNYKELLKISDQISKLCGNNSNFFDFKLRYKPGRPELSLKVNKEKSYLMGFTVKEIADALHARIRGLQATKIFEKGKEIEAIIRIEGKGRKSRDQIKNIQLVNKEGQRINLSNLVEFKNGYAPSEIWHKNKERMIQVSFSSTQYNLSQAIQVISPLLKELQLPKGYRVKIGGDYHEMERTYKNLLFAALVMLALVYMLLASLLESYSQPFIIMVTVPLALIGVSIAMMIAQLKLSMGVLIGIIMLGGIVVNNAIVLMDHYNNLCLRGISNIQAIVSSAHSRLRPILMTTTTTILGLIPMALDQSNGSQIWSPLAITVIGGLFCSTLLTLLVIPSVALIFKDFQSLFQAEQNQNEEQLT